MQTPVPYFSLTEQTNSLRKELMAAFNRCLDTNAYCLGPEVDAFEKEFAAWNNSAHTIAVNSGTSALHLGLLLLGVAPGDEVITTPFTFASTSWAISYAGARPVYVDIEPETYNIDPSKIEAAITSKTKAILPVHLYGHPCELEPLQKIARKHKLGILEDAAQAHGAHYQGGKVGNFGECGAFSFYPTKNLGALGEGGMLTTSDPKMAERARALRNHGSYRRYYYDEIGYNYRMEGIQGAALRIKLKHLDENNRRRGELATLYTQQISGLPIVLPRVKHGVESAWHLYVIRSPRRDELAAHLNQNGIGTAIHYPVPLHLQQCYAFLGHKPGDFPVAEQVARECLALPFYPEMASEQVKQVCEAIRTFR
ncbi:MAG: DegT/DnrJ/EryC1/StrS family aminotransferase [Methylacidiphilales bacterium]|nr:DegT/DnrJ/EryC1/StrS family aminotransferase [Candidatus Methylacidiphilales bacterium]